MRDYGINVLSQYHIEVTSTRKTRGAILCDTDQGLLLLKEAKVSRKRVPVLHEICVHLENCGYENVDKILRNKEDQLVSEAEDGTKYLVKRWFDGRECDIRKEYEVMEGSKNLASLHLMLEKPIDLSGVLRETPIDLADFRGNNLKDEYVRHNRELNKVRSFIRSKVSKGEFELEFLKYFNYIYDEAKLITASLEESGYEELYKASLEGNTVIHGDYNYHNILMTSQGMATTNFDHFYVDIQVADLYYFLRKAMEKHRWNERLGDGMLNAYSRIRSLSEAELGYVALRLAYPEKFWKVANTYYHSNKAWIPVKSVEKLQIAIRQMEEKKEFLKNIFSFQL